MRTRLSRRITLNVLALGVFAFSVFPVYWMVLTAFKPTKEIQAETPSFLPTHVTFTHFSTAVNADGFWTFWRNSGMVAISAVLASLVVACLAAYAVGRMKWKGRQAFILMVFIAQMTPWEALLIPMYVIARDTDMLDKLPMLTLIYFMMTLPFTIVTLRGFLKGDPGRARGGRPGRRLQPVRGVPADRLPAARAGAAVHFAVRFHHRVERVRLREPADHQEPGPAHAAGLALVVQQHVRYGLGRHDGRGHPVHAARPGDLPGPAGPGDHRCGGGCRQGLVLRERQPRRDPVPVSSVDGAGVLDHGAVGVSGGALEEQRR